MTLAAEVLLTVHVGYIFFHKNSRISQGTIGYYQGRILENKEHNKVLDVDVDTGWKLD